jgi:polar amino acid transport system substrate-binding protein
VNGRTVISRRDDPPYPPMSARAGLIAKTAIASGPPASSVVFRRNRAGLIVRRAGALVAAVVGLVAAAGCAAAPARPASPAPHAAAQAQARAAAEDRAVSKSQTSAKAAATCNPDASSLAPLGPPDVTPGSYMARIKARGYLIAGVDQSTYHFGYLNPLDGQIEGFDIDMIRAVAQAIFGNPNKVEFKAISDAQRIPAITSGSVDIVAHTMTITCQRLTQVDFSSVYFDAHERVLIPDNSTATGGLADLGGQKVCATTGSDSVTTIQDYPTHPKVVQVPFWTDCLVLLQQDQVAAISTDDAILYGLQAQDPFTKVVGADLEDEPYGLAMSKQQPGFVRFVNAVLAQEESDGAWEKSYQHWVSPTYQKPPTPEYAS